MLSGGEIPLSVRVSERARRLTLKLSANGDAVELVMPQRVPLSAARAFVDGNRGWIEARLRALPPRNLFADGTEVPILGENHRIRHMGLKSLGRGAVWIEDKEIRVVGDPAHMSRRVQDYLKTIARREFSERARRLAQVIGRPVERVTIRDMKSRWGSCSSTGSLAFSWRVILAPEPVLHYLVAHEVAHLAEMNHGVRFWRLVEQLAPGAEAQRAWLQRNRATLMRYG